MKVVGKGTRMGKQASQTSTNSNSNNEKSQERSISPRRSYLANQYATHVSDENKQEQQLRTLKSPLLTLNSLSCKTEKDAPNRKAYFVKEKVSKWEDESSLLQIVQESSDEKVGSAQFGVARSTSPNKKYSPCATIVGGGDIGTIR